MDGIVPYVGISAHGTIGDRRTAGLVAADGTLDWLCLPDYDDQIVLGALVDADRGGYWRLGPTIGLLGSQRYHTGSCVLVTTWLTPAFHLELTDAMAWPENDRPSGVRDAHAVIRRLRCVRGEVACTCDLDPRLMFEPLPALDASALIQPLSVWTSRPIPQDGARVLGQFVLREGEEMWGVLASGCDETWTRERAAKLLAAADTYWNDWVGKLSYTGPRAQGVMRSALAVHLLGHAGDGAVVAAPTTSLPERLGGTWNADYRLSWVRDNSIALATMTQLGDVATAERYMDWLANVAGDHHAPMQPLYKLDGTREAEPREHPELEGYRGSRPVRLGNHAWKQHQFGSLGFLAECVYQYRVHGGKWKPAHWELIASAANTAAQHWRNPDNGIWELSVPQHYIASSAMCWVALDRAIEIGQELGLDDVVEQWRGPRDQVCAHVVELGWSDELGAFRQRTEAHNIDSAALLIPLMHMLPADDPRVAATTDRIIERLTIDGFAFRFIPKETPGVDPLPLGELEGAFLPCTFWLATVLAMSGRSDAAEAIIAAAERVAGPLGMFSEGVDVRTKQPLGNSPLLFSQTEYVRAVTELARSRLLGRARMLFGRAELRLRKALRVRQPTA